MKISEKHPFFFVIFFYSDVKVLTKILNVHAKKILCFLFSLSSLLSQIVFTPISSIISLPENY